MFIVFFFFSSRRRHTRFDCDWSSDVCSSDLPGRPRMLTQLLDHYGYLAVLVGTVLEGETILILGGFAAHQGYLHLPFRSEERRVGKECRSRWSPYHEKKKNKRENESVIKWR